ncbi:unnamed protein product [Paramecium primaurelia]|uniref:Uncharacterized protein n=1 Tax=Paramecium primaurelia TaxID=5886 RepID=A0A8S1JP56_PARPR|nr:unnamed protein product [Paramecium primaurelia]
MPCLLVLILVNNSNKIKIIRNQNTIYQHNTSFIKSPQFVQLQRLQFDLKREFQ